jgi:hypothetical protein
MKEAEMRTPSRNLLLVLAATLALPAAQARAQVAAGITDPNVAPKDVLVTLPHVDEALAGAPVDARPFDGALALDAFLESQGLTPERRGELYARAFVHVDLDRASSREIQLIPGAGAHGPRVRGVPPLEELGSVRQGDRQVRRRQGDRPPLAILRDHRASAAPQTGTRRARGV